MDYRDNINLRVDSLSNLHEKLPSITMRQLIKVWGEYLFGEHDPEYIQEWVDRYKERGYYAFISHMDGLSRKYWFAFHQLWAEVNAGRDWY